MQIEKIEKGHATIITTRPEEENIDLSPESTLIVSASDMVKVFDALSKFQNRIHDFNGVMFAGTGTESRGIYILLACDNDIECVSVI